MPTILDYSNLTAGRRPFNMVELSLALANMPHFAGYFQKIGMFTPKPIRTTSFAVEYAESKIHLLPSSARGSVMSTPSATQNRDRKAITLTTAHLEVVKEVLAEDVQNVRAFGAEEANAELMTMVQARDEVLADIRQSIDATIEYMMVGALKGEVRDGANNVIVDLFAAFDITAPTPIVLDLTKPLSVEANKAIVEMRKAVGEAVVVDELLAICGTTAYRKILEKAIDETKSRAQDSPIDINNVSVNGVVRGGVKFVQYPGGVGSTDFIGTNDIHYVPLQGGVPLRNLFVLFYAPADYAETVNTLPLLYYAKAMPLPFDKGLAINAQSNPLPICTRPKCLLKSTLT